MFRPKNVYLILPLILILEAALAADLSAAVTPTAEANDATRKFLAEGFNRPSVDDDGPVRDY